MDVTIHSFDKADRDWLVAAHGTHYAREEGFDESFETLVAQIINTFIARHDPKREHEWVVWQGDHRLGCIFCVKLDDTTAKLRLFLLEPEARGLGLGRQLLETCTGFARDVGYRRMSLWTHESHKAACTLYAKTGWVLEDSRPVQSFGAALIEQSWSFDLQS